ncbi:MAG: Crp/Fnr family transcriptional regulator [Desulfomonilaceae bacterium]
MIIQKASLFKDLSQQAMNETARIVAEETHAKGTQLYAPQDPAKYFYILVTGRVRLALGNEPELDYTVMKEGEVFGWSSVVGREFYTTRAECVVPTKLVKIDRDDLNQIFQKYPADGVIFFKRLARAVVQRLVDNYNAGLREVTSTSVELVALAFS